MTSLNYRIRTGLAGLWAAIVTVIVFVVSLLTWGHTYGGWLYARMLGSVGMLILGIKIKISGKENLPREPSIILINHQSNFDAFFLGTLFPRNTVVIAKRQMLKVPLFGIILKATRNILVDREDAASAKKSIKDAITAVQEDKNNIFIFPEGTRSKGRGLGKFKKGAFVMAIAAKAPIVPVVNQPMEHVMDPRRKFLKSGTHEIRVLPAIPTRDLKFRDADALLEQVEALFQRELDQFAKT